MSAPEFRAWPKTPRMFRDMVITEKIDGTNAAVIVEPGDPSDSQEGWVGCAEIDGAFVKVGAQKRTSTVTPEADNFGFAAWVREHRQTLAERLGVGYHFGEWWGSGIQRGYGLTVGEKRFSLFNVNRYADLADSGIGLGVVPVLARYTFDTSAVRAALVALAEGGSVAAPGFAKPEGVVIFHTAAGTVFKALLDGDDQPKGAGQ